MTVAEKHSTLLEGLSAIPDRQERFSAIVERGRRGLPLPVEAKTSVNRVPGCISPVWLTSSFAEGCLTFRAEAEAPVVNGLVRLLCELYDGARPEDILQTEPTLLEELDLIRDLTPTRLHGLRAARLRIRQIAEWHLIAR